MKHCQDIRPELSAYLDGELTAPQRAEVEAHLASCSRCREEVAELTELGTGMAALPKLDPPPEFLAEVRRKIAHSDKSEPMTWQNYLFRPVWLKVPLEAVALIMIIVLVQRFHVPTPVDNVASLRTAQAENPRRAFDDAVQPERVGSAQGAEQSPEILAKAEPLSSPVPASSAVEIRRNAFASTGGTNESTVASTLTAADVAGVARGLGIEQSKLGDVVIVHAAGLTDVRRRAEQLAAKCNGKVISVPPSKDAAGHLFFVELPREYAASFKLELLQASVDIPPSSGAAMRLGAGVLTGNGETNAGFDDWAALGLADEAKARTSTTTILEIMVVTPTN